MYSGCNCGVRSGASLVRVICLSQLHTSRDLRWLGALFYIRAANDDVFFYRRAIRIKYDQRAFRILASSFRVCQACVRAIRVRGLGFSSVKDFLRRSVTPSVVLVNVPVFVRRYHRPPCNARRFIYVVGVLMGRVIVCVKADEYRHRVVATIRRRSPARVRVARQMKDSRPSNGMRSNVIVEARNFQQARCTVSGPISGVKAAG